LVVRLIANITDDDYARAPCEIVNMSWRKRLGEDGGSRLKNYRECNERNESAEGERAHGQKECSKGFHGRQHLRPIGAVQRAEGFT
jgi:hypothetical protein